MSFKSSKFMTPENCSMREWHNAAAAEKYRALNVCLSKSEHFHTQLDSLKFEVSMLIMYNWRFSESWTWQQVFFKGPSFEHVVSTFVYLHISFILPPVNTKPSFLLSEARRLKKILLLNDSSQVSWHCRIVWILQTLVL